MVPPAYVKPYVKRGKTDAADADAICEAVTRPTMRFVPPKTMEQQSVLMLHKTRDLLIKQRTMLTNSLRSHLTEFGVISAQGPAGVESAIVSLHEIRDQWPELTRAAFVRNARDPYCPRLTPTSLRSIIVLTAGGSLGWPASGPFHRMRRRMRGKLKIGVYVDLGMHVSSTDPIY